jgi:hypothetical protein
MATRPAESLKKIAAELSELICSGSGDQLLMNSLLDQLRPTNNAGPVKHPLDIGQKQQKRPIGIWQPVEEEGKTVYKRNPLTKSEWYFWADVPVWYPKNNKQRIVLLGESVARAFLYHPCYTAAEELQGILNNQGDLKNSEIIDLARVGMHMEKLLDVAEASLQLEPDAVIIFAGNNWSFGLHASLGENDYKEITEIFKKDHLPGVRSFLEKRFFQIIISFLEKAKALFVQKNIPVLFIIPAFNLLDWKSCDTEKVFGWLPDGRRADWLKAKDLAEAALLNNEPDKLEQAARQMVQIDALHPQGHEFLAQSHIQYKRWQEAIRSLEAARDANLIPKGTDSRPRIYSIVRETILAEAHKYGIRVIDSYDVFKELLGIHIPDRTVYLDYCHLSVEGIKAMMRAAARELISLITRKEVAIEDIKGSGIVPSNEVQATAHLCAAIHNAHYGQSYDIISYHCRKAVSFTPDIKELMLLYIDFSTRYAAASLCRTFEEIILTSKTKRHLAGLGWWLPKGQKLMDIELVDALVDALQLIGVEKKNEVQALRMNEHKVGKKKINLLESYYANTSYVDFAIDPKPAFMQARNTRSGFHFVTDGAASIAFKIVYRAPVKNGSTDPVKIFINDTEKCFLELPVAGKWMSASFSICKKFLRNGVNRLIIQWPGNLEVPDIDHLAIDTYNFLNTVFPVVGEIYSLVASAADRCCTVDPGSCFVKQVKEPATLIAEEKN